MDLRKYPSNPKDAKNLGCLGFANGNLCGKQRVIENMWMIVDESRLSVGSPHPYFSQNCFAGKSYRNHPDLFYLQRSSLRTKPFPVISQWFPTSLWFPNNFTLISPGTVFSSWAALPMRPARGFGPAFDRSSDPQRWNLSSPWMAKWPERFGRFNEDRGLNQDRSLQMVQWCIGDLYT